MKKILRILLMGILVIGLTGCGNKNTNEKNQNEYSEAIKEFRESSVGMLGDKTFGEILDYALQNVKYEEKKQYNLTSDAIVITGKDKNSGEDIEIVWLIKEEVASSGFEKMTKGTEDLGYSQFLSYCSDYVDEMEK